MKEDDNLLFLNSGHITSNTKNIRPTKIYQQLKIKNSEKIRLIIFRVLVEVCVFIRSNAVNDSL
jgi:hypothetical protein